MTSAAWILVIVCAVCLGWALAANIHLYAVLRKLKKSERENREVTDINVKLRMQLDKQDYMHKAAYNNKPPAPKTGYVIKEEIFV